MSEIVPTLSRELEQLELELDKNPLYRRAKLLRELIAGYAEQSPGTLPQQVMVAPRSVPPTAPPPNDGSSSKKAMVKREIDRLLRAEGPTHRNRILEVLIAKKLMGAEKDPMQALAVYLSGFSNDFVSEGQGIWNVR
jgi:hypothetical protein